MDPDQQVAITLSFMQAIAPVIARHHVRQAELQTTSEMRQIAAANAKMTVEFAVHLTAQFASLDAALNSTQTQDVSQGQNPVAPGEQGAGNPVAGVQPPAAGVLEGTYPVSDLRRDRH
jgi:hypothetical protein